MHDRCAVGLCPIWLGVIIVRVVVVIMGTIEGRMRLVAMGVGMRECPWNPSQYHRHQQAQHRQDPRWAVDPGLQLTALAGQVHAKRMPEPAGFLNQSPFQ